MLNTQGIYNIPLQDYINDPCETPSLSASIAHAMVSQSPLHAWMKHPRLNPQYERDDSSRMDLGTIAHSILLEGDASKVVVIEANDWRTNAAKEARDQAYQVGKLPILKGKMEEVNKMVKVAREAIAGSELAAAFANGKAEQTFIYQQCKSWLRSRPDWMTNDYRMLIDYKTTSNAEPNAFMRGPLLGNGYDLQAAIGVRGISILKQPKNCQFVFMVQEIESPYAVSFVGLTPAFLELANKKLDRAMVQWEKCLATNSWPGYPSKICYLEPPAWVAMEQAEKQGVEI